MKNRDKEHDETLDRVKQVFGERVMENRRNFVVTILARKKVTAAFVPEAVASDAEREQWFEVVKSAAREHVPEGMEIIDVDIEEGPAS